MTVRIHHLTGCAPTPLAHYLKALGILRLIVEQKKDPAARGWWQDEAFHLATTLTREELERFFLQEYAPTPLISPWNGGSGFYDQKDSPLAPILASSSERLMLFKDAILIAKKLLGEVTEKPDKDAKRVLVRRIMNGFPDHLRPWLEVVALITSEGDDKYPALFGTGGNDGNLDFTDAFMRRLADIYDLKTMTPGLKAVEWLTGSLWGQPSANLVRGKSPGQFNPGAQGGANSSLGAKGENFVNPFDFILMLEGALFFVVSLTKRSDSAGRPGVAAPFSVHHVIAGTASAGTEEDHGEQWMPLWRFPASSEDIQQLFIQGRAKIGSRYATDSVDFARAVAGWGVASKIDSFVRYGYLKRLGGMYFQAVPLGRYLVASGADVALLDDLDARKWTQKNRRACSDKDAPDSIRQRWRRIDEAIMRLCSRVELATGWQELMLALGEFESMLVNNPGFTAKNRLQPIPRLRPEWVKAADDGSVEFRLALSLAGQSADGRGNDSVRHHWMPMNKFGGFETDEYGLRKDPRVVCHGLDGERNLVALVRRRITEGDKSKYSRFPLMAAHGCDAHLTDIAAYLSGAVDLQRVVSLARALLAVNFSKLEHRPLPPHGNAPPPIYGLFRLACLPWPLCRGGAKIAIRTDPAVVQRLVAGDLQEAGNLAIRRLTASGLVPVIRHVGGNDPVLARRLAASLAFPISMPTAVWLADRLTKPEINKQKGSAV